MFENLFFGFSFEFARGASAFAGGHYAKINTFNSENIVFGVTPLSQEQFDILSDKKWELDWSFGINLDILVLTNLLRR